MGATSPLNRLKPTHYVLPVACLALAAAIRLGEAPIEHLSTSFRVMLSLFATCLVFATVFIVLHHAERIAHRLGEPYGTLVLTLAVTTIEVSVIVSMMLHGENNPSLARESVFSTVMIVCGGVVGICLTFGGLRHRHQDLKRQGTNAYLAVLIALSVLTLILPDFTLASPPGTFAPMQLAFVSLLSVMLYGSFVFAQMARHRDDFVEELIDQESQPETTAEHSAISANVVLLAIGLIGIVLLTEQIAAGIEDGLKALQFTQADALVGAFIATLVLLPESVSAVRAALNNELQRSLNVALGIGMRHDRPDHSLSRPGQPHHWPRAHTWAGFRRHGAVAAGTVGQHRQFQYRTDYRPDRAGPPRRVLCLPAADLRSLREKAKRLQFTGRICGLTDRRPPGLQGLPTHRHVTIVRSR